jgi:hypothetical protein
MMINGLGLLPQLPLLLGLRAWQPLVRWMSVQVEVELPAQGPAPRRVIPLLTRMKFPSVTVNVPAESETT